MKLYEVFIHNGWQGMDADWSTKLIVANSIEEAEARARNLLLGVYFEGKYNKPYFDVEEINEVDGFTVTVTR